MSVDPAAYGLRLRGLESTPWLAVRDAGCWPEITVVPEALDRVAKPRLDLERREALLPAQATLDVIMHPLIAHIGLAHADAQGWDSLHAGSVIGRDGAWLVAGVKEVGKSTLMAAAAAAGVRVLADDVAILADGHVLAGPRCVDLRHRHAGAATAVRTGQRWRVTLDPVCASAPLRGVVFPAWGERLEVVPVPVADRLQRFGAMRRRDRYPRHPRTMLELTATSVHELRRPRDLAGVAASVDVLRELIGA